MLHGSSPAPDFAMVRGFPLALRLLPFRSSVFYSVLSRTQGSISLSIPTRHALFGIL